MGAADGSGKMSDLYAKETTVTIEKSRAELETLLRKYGGVGFAYATSDHSAMIGFKIKTGDAENPVILAVRMNLPLPARNERRFTYGRGHRQWTPRTTEGAADAWEQACRSLWRSLVLTVKAKLEACHVGISTVEREFMADLVMPDGRTLTETLGADIAKMLTTGVATQLCLPGV